MGLADMATFLADVRLKASSQAVWITAMGNAAIALGPDWGEDLAEQFARKQQVSEC